jgi:hypothetical protein
MARSIVRNAVQLEVRGSRRLFVREKPRNVVEPDDRVDGAARRNPLAAARERLEFRIESRAKRHEQIELLALRARFLVARLLQRLFELGTILPQQRMQRPCIDE